MLSKVQKVLQNHILDFYFSKEGETFVSINLAATFALSAKRSVLLGMDIRNPRLDEC
jgi:Mrp family chromosome partitioning ATPase